MTDAFLTLKEIAREFGFATAVVEEQSVTQTESNANHTPHIEARGQTQITLTSSGTRDFPMYTPLCVAELPDTTQGPKCDSVLKIPSGDPKLLNAVNRGPSEFRCASSAEDNETRE